LQQIAANRQIVGRQHVAKSWRWYPTENMIAEISGNGADSMGKIGLRLLIPAANRAKRHPAAFLSIAVSGSIDFQQ
jgi:hypothetical protein